MLMWVPARCVQQLLIGWHLTLLKFIFGVCAKIENDSITADCQAFIDWCIYAGCLHNIGDDQHSLIHIHQDVLPPVADSVFLNWSKPIKPQLAQIGQSLRSTCSRHYLHH
jgi:hypothetical protein